MSALAQGISVAGTAMIGQSNGRGEFKEARHLSTQIIAFALVSGCIVAPLLALIAFPVSWNVDSRISQDVFTYLALNALVLPFLFLENTYNAIKNAAGKPEAPFIRMVIMLILKIMFNALFIAVLKLGITGSVMSSLVSNILISVWMYYELFVKPGDDRLELKGFRFDFKAIREIVRMGIPSMLNSIMLSLGFYLINNEIQKYGPVVLNGQGIASNITSIAFILPSSFGASVTTIVSMNIGAGKGLKARKGCIVGWRPTSEPVTKE
jgi:Na+-driven multidrug efflux pump